MRAFFINSLEKMIIGDDRPHDHRRIMLVMSAPEDGVGAGFAMLLGGVVWIFVVGSMAYLGLGIYHNARRTVEPVEELGKRMR